MLKTVGLITVFSVCCLFGFYKSLYLKNNTEEIGRLADSCSSLADRILAERRELGELVWLCFGEEYIEFSQGRFYACEKKVGKEEAKILNEMFSGIGMMDCESEHRRIKTFSKRLEEIYGRALQKNAELGKLYKTLGVSSGLFLVLFLI